MVVCINVSFTILQNIDLISLHFLGKALLKSRIILSTVMVLTSKGLYTRQDVIGLILQFYLAMSYRKSLNPKKQETLIAFTPIVIHELKLFEEYAP